MNLSWVALGFLAVALAWPVPILLARADWPTRAPGTALVLWQAVALAGGLSMIGALLSYGLMPFGNTPADGVVAFARYLLASALPASASFGQMFALSGAVLLAVHLVLNLALTFARAERSRQRHRQLVTLLSAPMPESPGLRIIDHEAPVAYCLPGTTRSVTVLSAGLFTLLDQQQLRAVISHENAHATQRHHLVLVAFRAWRSSLPWFPIATRALIAVTTLVEMLADDRARRDVPDATLARSIELVASASARSFFAETPMEKTASPRTGSPLTAQSRSALAADGDSAHRRIERLVNPQPVLSSAGRVFAAICGLALLAIPTAFLVMPIFA